MKLLGTSKGSIMLLMFFSSLSVFDGRGKFLGVCVHRVISVVSIYFFSRLKEMHELVDTTEKAAQVIIVL